MEIVCSICSRAKDQDPRHLPARQRYIGSHIAKIEAIAREMEKEFFVLSGVHGLVSADEVVPYYDHLLTDDEVDGISESINRQLAHWGIRNITFFTKGKPAWQPYLRALRQACDKAGVHLRTELLADDD